MRPISLSRVEQSRAHVLITRALGGTAKGYPQDADDAVRCGVGEALAFYSNGCHPFTVAKIFALAEKALIWRDLNCEQDTAAIYDLPSLQAAIGDRGVATTVAMLCGAHCKEGVWRDADGPATLVKFPQSLEEIADEAFCTR